LIPVKKKIFKVCKAKISSAKISTLNLLSARAFLLGVFAGNYGKAFAFMAHQQEMPGIVYMPTSAPQDRQDTIEVHTIEKL